MTWAIIDDFMMRFILVACYIMFIVATIWIIVVTVREVIDWLDKKEAAND